MNTLCSRFAFPVLMIATLAAAAFATAADTANTPPAATAGTSSIDGAHAAAMASYGRPVAWSIQRPRVAVERRHLNLSDDSPVVPASSIKPLLALIALEAGVLSGADEVLPWDGRRYASFPQWEKPADLSEAMQNSNESYFRTLAERIGRDRLAEWIGRIGYGNGQYGERAAEFHDGVLLITAQQQLEFIGRLGRGELPFSQQHVATVRESMRETRRGEAQVFGKTGTHLPRDAADTGGVGWWIGWVECGGQVTPFVLRVSLDAIDGRDKRIALGLRLLELDGLLPQQ